MKKSLLWVCLLLLSCCGNNEPTYKIGVDDLWYPLEIPGKEMNVLGFSTDLLQEIARSQKLQLILVYQSWDNLLEGLNKKQYEGALSSLRPYNFNEKKYDFSNLYLMTGHVLVVPVDSPLDSLDMLNGKEIGFPEGSHEDSLLVNAPGVLPRSYRSVSQALNDILDGSLDGALVDYLSAQSYIQDLYAGMLRITTAPLTDLGLRLVTLKSEPDTLIKAFDAGLKEAIDNGTYAKLAAKWGLPPLP
ncbi:MAG: transporter substrate-binding domain-containing protein [Chlamydiota bacterium]